MKQLAIMTAPHFGMRDMYKPAFWFSVSYGENLVYGALIILSADEMTKECIAANVYDISRLEGAPCQIEVKDNIVSFIKLLKTGGKLYE